MPGAKGTHPLAREGKELVVQLKFSTCWMPIIQREKRIAFRVNRQDRLKRHDWRGNQTEILKTLTKGGKQYDGT